jgi:hypothetical protein
MVCFSKLAESGAHDAHGFRHRPLSRRRARPLAFTLRMFGALARTRTPNLAGRNRLLFRLSYESSLDMQAGIEPARDEVAAHRVPISPLHEFGARGETRTPIFTSVYGSPVRNRCRVGARIGSPSRNRTEVSRFRTGRSVIELKGVEWSGWLDSHQRSPASKAGGDDWAPLHPDDWPSRQESNLHPPRS